MTDTNNLHPHPPNPRLPLYLIRLSQSHESFRQPELHALATHLNTPISIQRYTSTSPFCIIQFPSLPSSSPATHHAAAKQFISRSILAKAIYEFYAQGTDYTDLHARIKALPAETWSVYMDVSFRFSIDAFCASRDVREQREIVEGFEYLGFRGRIRMKDAAEEFVVFEEWPLLTGEEHSLLNSGVGGRGFESESGVEGDGIVTAGGKDTGDGMHGGERRMNGLPDRKPRRLFFGRFIGESRRDLIIKHDLKKRPYISTTSMDAELALVTATLALAAPGKIFLDPFTGTGGFMVAAAELGAVVLGSDIDGRSFRGKGKGLQKGIGANFERYKIGHHFGDCISADLTNSPFRIPDGSKREWTRWLDGIICDPPYGVREGLKVLGRREHDSNTTNGRATHTGPYFVDGVPSHLLPGFIAPKKPYSFNQMLNDILDFAVKTLVDGGRLAFWMPVANDADEEFPLPRHGLLHLEHSCIQVFNKWSRRLLVYVRVVGNDFDDVVDGVKDISFKTASGHKADELNQFRRMYFRGFADESPKNDHG